MSTLCPYSITKGDDGLSVKVEWDVHYLTDEQIGIVRKYVAETEAENEKLRELVKHLRECAKHNTCAACPYADDACDFDYDMRELGIEVDE